MERMREGGEKESGEEGDRKGEGRGEVSNNGDTHEQLHYY